MIPFNLKTSGQISGEHSNGHCFLKWHENPLASNGPNEELIATASISPSNVDQKWIMTLMLLN